MLGFTLLPKVLQASGYATHALGKWHLGFKNASYTPTFRGFDTFVGYWHWGKRAARRKGDARALAAELMPNRSAPNQPRRGVRGPRLSSLLQGR